MNAQTSSPVLDFQRTLAGKRYGTVLADPPWRFLNRTGIGRAKNLKIDNWEDRL